jgi:predicted Zn-dependent peptidase
LSKQSLGEEQNILLHEWLSRSGDASGGKLGDFMWNEVFPEGDARREADDVPEEVIAIKLADVRDFVGKHYHPDNATLAIVGDVDAGAALAAVHHYFDDLPRSAEPPPAAPRAQVSFTGKMTLTLVSQNEQPKLNVVYTVPKPTSADEHAVARVMAARLERVLSDELVTKRLWASEVHVYVGDLAGTGYVAISVGLRGNVRHAVVENAVDAIIEHVQTGQYDVEDAKRSVAVDRTRLYSMLATRAMALTEANESTSLDVELSAIGRVTFEQARKYARERLPSSRRLVVREKAATEAQRVGAVYSREGRLFGGESK